jgi:hypothetical protein
MARNRRNKRKQRKQSYRGLTRYQAREQRRASVAEDTGRRAFSVSIGGGGSKDADKKKKKKKKKALGDLPMPQGGGSSLGIDPLWLLAGGGVLLLAMSSKKK